VDGYISQMSVSIPWSSLLSDSSFVEVTGLMLTVQPKQRADSGMVIVIFHDNLFLNSDSCSNNVYILLHDIKPFRQMNPTNLSVLNNLKLHILYRKYGVSLETEVLIF